MREIRLSGSEGGEAELNRLSLPLCALESTRNQRGESSLEAGPLRPVTKCYWVAVRRGGELQEVNNQSVGNELDTAWSSRRACGPIAKPRLGRMDPESCALRGRVIKRARGPLSGWRRNGWKVGV
jgi:hypothetical protein